MRIVEAPALTAINMRLRDDYTRDAAGGVGRWNKIIEKAGIKFEMKLPHEAFNRKIGVFAGKPFGPEGSSSSGEEWDDSVANWLPDPADGDFIQSLMKPASSRANSPAGSRRRRSASTTSPAISNM